MRWDIVLLTCAAMVFLIRLYARDRERQRRVRNEFFADCASLFQHLDITQDGLHYPVLTGTYRGFDIKLEPVVDDMTVRKLPSLWLKVSLYGPVRYSGAFDLLNRPRGVEFYSPASELPWELKRPSGWPADAMIRSDDPAAMPPTETMEKHLHLFDDEKMKELLIVSRGVRLVHQADQAERAQYSVLRQSHFSKPRLAPDLAVRLLEAAVSIYQSVAAVPVRAAPEREEVLA